MKNYYSSYEEYQQIEGHGFTPPESPRRFDISELDEKAPALSTSRRDFLKMMGFTLGYAALATSCENPVRKAIPYLNQPLEITPGISGFYASTYFDGDDYAGILVKTREGRPIKIEGNKLSSLTRGGTSARIQASVLNLYDLARLQHPLENDQETSWESIDAGITSKLKQISLQGGKIVLLTSTIISPSSRQLIQDFTAAYPTTQWITYDTISASGILEASEMTFGQRMIPDYRFDKAKLIVAFNADFLGNWIAPVMYTKRYAQGRLLTDSNSMSRHIQYESFMSLTGSNADTRVQIKPSQEGIILLNLYNRIAGMKGATIYPADPSPVEIDSLAADLLNHEGAAMVISGSNDPSVQIIIHAINYLIGSYGTTIGLGTPVNLKQGIDSEMITLVDEMNSGKVAALIAWNANPAYDYPEAGRFISGLQKTELTVSLTERPDETSQAVQYVCAVNNYLESWSDAEPSRGHFSLGQPVIPRLFDTRQAQDCLLKWMGSEKDYYTYLQEYWQNNLFPLQSAKGLFTDFWNQCVHDGIFEMPPDESAVPDYRQVSLPSSFPAPQAGMELVLYQKMGTGTGRHANNPWLQELPDPITRATWDNYLCISPADAQDMELASEDVVLLNGNLEIPVIVQPGQPKGTLSLALGYGRTNCGKVANGIGINAYPLITMADGHRHYFSGNASIEKTGKTYPLGRTQTHHTMEGRAIVRETTVEEWRRNPKSGNEMHQDIVKQNLTLYQLPVFDGIHWGMAINLNACTGCGNCVISCQAENNVAVIGKEQIRMRRIMHWMRIDRYYSEEADNPEVVHMPVMCQHCDNAPCENVCPVAATPHSSEGLNQMAYNRCIGTRYCMNNCPYRVRRFNWFEYANNDEFDYNLNNDLSKLVLNPDVTVRSRGVVEKCSFCVQRLQEKKLEAKKQNRTLRDGEIQTACQESCPANAIVFGDMNDPESTVSKLMINPRTYQLLEQIHTLPSVHYLTKVRNMDPADKKRNYNTTYPIVSGEETTENNSHE
jgi:molybdopterin-containing oxidoreductase family iron-sulfur binding subunit